MRLFFLFCQDKKTGIKPFLVTQKRLTFLNYISKLSISPCGGMVDTPVLGTGAFSVSVRVRPRAFFSCKFLTWF